LLAARVAFKFYYKIGKKRVPHCLASEGVCNCVCVRVL